MYKNKKKSCTYSTTVYILKNLIDKTTKAYGSISKICKDTDLKPDTLYSAFSRKKVGSYSNDKFKVIKTKLIRS